MINTFHKAAASDRLILHARSKHQASDAAEAVDAHSDSHFAEQLVLKLSLTDRSLE